MKRMAVLLAVLTLVAAACGGGDDDSSGVATLSNDSDTTVAQDEAGSGEVDQEAALIAMTECLRDHGVEIEDPTVDADGNVQLGAVIFEGETDPREVMRPAMEACQENLEGVTLGFGRPDETEIQDTLYEYASCMRDNGFDMPDPDFSNFGPRNGDGDGEGSGGEGDVIITPFGEIDPDDPAFESAQAACDDILAGFGPGGRGGVGRGPGGGGDNG